MKKGLMLFTFLTLFLVASVFATMNDVKVIVCNDINVTEPNCSIWWNALNLTEANFSYNNITNYTNNITLVYEDYRNQTLNETIIHTNHSTTENNTYVSYNYTGNLSNSNWSTDIDGKITNALVPYALKTSIPGAATPVNMTSIDEFEDAVIVWRWIFIILILLTIIAVGYLIFTSTQS